MSIVIEGVEMPSMGYREIRIHPNGTVTERLDRCEVTVGKAVSVPPHGRLIDVLWVRDQIIKQWMDYSDDSHQWMDYSDDSHMYKRGMEDAYEVIRNAPTVIPGDKGIWLKG